MRWFKRKSRSKSSAQVGAQSTVSRVSKESFADYLLQRGFYQLASYTLLKYYDVCPPVTDAMDRVSREIAKIEPVVFNKETEKIEYDHPVLDLLKQPNPIDTYNSLIERMLAYYLIAGESFFLSTGLVKNPPLEFFVSNPTAVNIFEGTDGFISEYNISEISGSNTYLRNVIGGRFRYYSRIEDQELFQMKRFNPKGTFSSLHGQSLLHTLYYEIEQYINGSVHNLALLLRGGSMSGIVSTKNDEILTDDQREQIKQELHNFITGPQNAGRIGFFDAPIDFNALSSTNRDMDYLSMKKETKKMIYDRFGIPAPFYSDEVMTMANRETARLDFYDDAILPLLDRMFEELSLFLMYRYPDGEKKIITYDVSTIEALEPRKLDQLSKTNKMNILTPNEQRIVLGHEDIKDGDELLVPNTLVPISMTGNDVLEPDTKTTRDDFSNLMQEQLNSDGSRRYSDSEIAEIADEEDLK